MVREEYILLVNTVLIELAIFLLQVSLAVSLMYLGSLALRLARFVFLGMVLSHMQRFVYYSNTAPGKYVKASCIAFVAVNVVVTVHQLIVLFLV